MALTPGISGPANIEPVVDANTMLLMHFDGTTGATFFRDEKGHSFTSSGSIALTDYTSRFGGTCLTANGTGYISTPNTTDFALGNSAFTIEFWINFAVIDSNSYVVLTTWGSAASDKSWLFQMEGTTLYFYYSYDGSTQQTKVPINANSGTPGPALVINRWYHVDVSRLAAGGGFYTHLDGVRTNSIGVGTNSIYGGTGALQIMGCNYIANIGMIGYMDELRITKGTNRYNNNQINPVPYKPFVELVDPTTVVLMHFNEGTSSTVYSDERGHVFTPNANVAHNSFAKFGATSAYFPGNGVLTTPDSTDFTFGNGDFTIEFWIAVSSTANQTVIGQLAGSNQVSWFISVDAPSSLTFYWTYDGISYLVANIIPSITLNTYYHVAITRSGTALRTFSNGALTTNYNSSGGGIGTSTFFDSTAVLQLGSTAGGLNGYIDELRITKGLARYTAAFTSPSVPFTG